MTRYVFMYVIKANGKKEVFDGISTGAIFKRVMALLNKYLPSRASCYDLKEAIMRLGPAGFPFETFIAEILREHGFQTVLRSRLRGKCAEHEIDVIATDKSGKRFIIECKFHNSSGNYIDLKEALYTYARLLDLNNGNNSFDGAWLSCNTKASTEAQRYAQCMNIRLLCFVKLYEGKYYIEFIKSEFETLLRKSGIEITEKFPILLGAGRILKEYV